MKRYFAECQSLNELKAAYKRLAMLHHPDRGGDLRTMQAINAEYDAMFERFKFDPIDPEREYEAHAERATGVHSTAEVAEDFRKIIDALMKLDGIEIELCGSWLWISGDTFAVKDELKAAGCRWQRKKQKWYWHPPEARTGYSKRAASMSHIRAKYGSQLIKGKDDAKRAALTA